MIEMYDKRSEVRYTSKGNSLSREIEAIKEKEYDISLKLERDVGVYYNPKLLKVLKNILLKITKAS